MLTRTIYYLHVLRHCVLIVFCLVAGIVQKMLILKRKKTLVTLLGRSQKTRGRLKCQCLVLICIIVIPDFPKISTRSRHQDDIIKNCVERENFGFLRGRLRFEEIVTETKKITIDFSPFTGQSFYRTQTNHLKKY